MRFLIILFVGAKLSFNISSTTYNFKIVNGLGLKIDGIAIASIVHIMPLQFNK